MELISIIPQHVTPLERDGGDLMVGHVKRRYVKFYCNAVHVQAEARRDAAIRVPAKAPKLGEGGCVCLRVICIWIEWDLR